MGLLDRILGRRQPTSSDIAKERLQLVLVHDRSNISPAVLEKMKDELIAVISRYVEIEATGVEVAFTHSRTENRLVANIPVVGPSGRAAPSKPSRRSRPSG